MKDFSMLQFLVPGSLTKHLELGAEDQGDESQFALPIWQQNPWACTTYYISLNWLEAISKNTENNGSRADIQQKYPTYAETHSK